jgi:GntR family transcriptional regulator
MRLENNSLIPLYQQIIDDIRWGIEEGRYQAGQKIPSETELSNIYSVSRITIRRAVEELSSAGYLTKKQGKGTYVNPPKMKKMIHRKSALQRFEAMCHEAGRVPGSKVVVRTHGKPRAIEADQLAISRDAEVVALRRILTADGVPVAYQTMLFPSPEFASLEHELRDNVSTNALLEQLGLRMPSASRDSTIGIIRATSELAELLQVCVGEPLFDEYDIMVDEDDVPVYLHHVRALGSSFLLCE